MTLYVKKLNALRLQQRLDRAALIHRAISFGHLVERQGQVEDLAGVDLPLPYKIDRVGQKAADRGRSPVQVDVGIGEEQVLAVQNDAMRNARRRFHSRAIVNFYLTP
jgi:hypothetical protein